MWLYAHVWKIYDNLECLVDSLNRDRYLIQHDFNFAAGDLTVLKLMWCYIGLCKGNQFQYHLLSPVILYFHMKIWMHQQAVQSIIARITTAEFTITSSTSGSTHAKFLGLKTEVLNFLTLVKRPQMAYMSPDDLSTKEKVSSLAQGKIEQISYFSKDDLVELDFLSRRPEIRDIFKSWISELSWILGYVRLK